MFIASLNFTEYNPIAWELCVSVYVCVFHGAPNKDGDNTFLHNYHIISSVISHVVFLQKFERAPTTRNSDQ